MDFNLQACNEVRDGMHIDWDVPITMDDGVVLRADIFRPVPDGHYPVILTYGPYAKGLAFQDGYPSAWERMVREHPDVAQGSSNLYQNWEVVDPEKWVQEGYACVRVDSRGCGCSPGYIEHFSPRESKDFYDCIEWAGVQPWSNGKVGLNGVSYYGSNQWHVASRQPLHLSVMCIWEGRRGLVSRHDPSRRHSVHVLGELVRHAGQDGATWRRRAALTCPRGSGMRAGNAGRGGLARKRCNFGNDIRAHPLDDGYHKARSPVWEKVVTPFLSAANWGGQGLHPRGNFEGFVRAASREKWLEAHGIEHWTHFYTDYGRKLQLRFFDYFLKGEKNGWDQQPRVLLQVRHPGEKFVGRAEHEWPLARTQWTRLYLDTADTCLKTTPAAV